LSNGEGYKGVDPHGNKKKSLVTTDKSLGLCGDLNRRFYWFDNQFTSKFIETSRQFLVMKLYFYLFSITDKPSPLWKDNDYFVTQIDLTWDCPLYIKMSNTAAQVILDNAFGSQNEKEEELDLKNITELEAQILTAYNEFLYKKIADAFLDKREIDEIQLLEDTRKNLIYLTFYVYSEHFGEEPAGRIIISFPEYSLKETDLLPFPQNPIDILGFEDSCTRTNVFVGKSKISLEDLKALEPDDIVILEKSNLHFMTIRGDEEVTFSVNPDPKLVINYDDTAGGKKTMKETNTPVKNIWDNLQVEVSAEFHKIKMSLGELRQITEGLVIDIASIVQNEITLHVDNEKIASGELVILGDKYGVRITKVFPEPKQDAEEDFDELAIEDKQRKKSIQSSEEDDEEYDEEDDDEDNDDDEEDEEDEDDEDFEYDDFEIEEEDDI
jgi:flagellar motor switch/type III secretory pathway protein FliN